jgi:hypothetical protein
MFTALVILLLSLPAPSAGDRSFCTDVANGTYNRNSTYSSNLRSLADDLIAGAMAAHSATGTSGTVSEKVYGAVLCRGDSTGADCGRRLREAFDGTINAKGTGAVCALHRDVALYSELYQLRFSDEDFLSSFSNTPEWVDATNLNLVPAAESRQFDEIVTKLARSLADVTARQPDRYATADAPWSSEERERTVYGLAQCTQDMPPERCRACLDTIVAELRQKIGVGRMGGAIHGARCTLRYETDTQFFTATGKLLPLPMLLRI